MRKILYISGSRADYGLAREALFSFKKHPQLKVEVIATGVHLMPEFGKTINEIKKDGFKVHEIKAVYEKDNKGSMADFIGKLICLSIKKIKKIKPDIILILGDRGEALAGAIVGTHLTIPVVHIHGGEVTATVDEMVRHATTKLSHIHLAVTKKSAERIIKMGEDPWRVFITGTPGLDSSLITKKEISKKYKLDLSKPILLVVQHPVTEEISLAPKQIKTTMEAVKELKFQTIVLYPNADAGGRKMIKIIDQYRKYPFVQIYKNIPHRDYLSLMRTVKVLLGNSSSAVIEAPSFYLPAVNIGIRQQGREKSKNIIDVNQSKKEIKKAILKAIFDKKFRQRLKSCQNPYGQAKAGKKIANILSKIKIDKKLLEKRITY